MKDILVFGSEGFIGSNLIARFIQSGFSVSGIDRMDNASKQYDYNKIISTTDITEFLLKNNFRFVINAAGSGNVGFSVAHPLSDFESNCFDTAKLLDAVRITNSNCAYVHISSAAVYGNPKQLPVPESASSNPLSPYGWHKLISEWQCQEYFQLYGLRCCVLRPFSVYGPGLHKQLFWDLYHKAVGKSSVELFGTGKESRDFIYISDLVMAVEKIVKSAPMKGESYNIASGVETSIDRVANLFLQGFRPAPSVFFNGKVKMGDPLNWQADISKISALGFIPEVSIEAGTKITFDWINKVSG